MYEHHRFGSHKLSISWSYICITRLGTTSNSMSLEYAVCESVHKTTCKLLIQSVPCGNNQGLNHVKIIMG